MRRLRGDKMKYEEAIDILTYQALVLGRASGKLTLERSRIEALSKAVEAIEKQIPKKPYDIVHCPLCKIEVELQPIDTEQVTYCLHCGQAIDWSD